MFGNVDGDVYTIHESSCNTYSYGAVNNVQSKNYYDDASYYSCFGGTLVDSAGTTIPSG